MEGLLFYVFGGLAILSTLFTITSKNTGKENWLCLEANQTYA